MPKDGSYHAIFIKKSAGTHLQYTAVGNKRPYCQSSAFPKNTTKDYKLARIELLTIKSFSLLDVVSILFYKGRLSGHPPFHPPPPSHSHKLHGSDKREHVPLEIKRKHKNVSNLLVFPVLLHRCVSQL